MTAYEEKKVDAFILSSSRLKTTSNEYAAIQTLLEQGNLLYCFLGKWETLELTKILIQLQFRYEYVTGGIQLRENSKEDFYYRIINPRAAPKISYPDSVLLVGKQEKYRENGIGWADRRFEE